jgi:hypothetical protein
MADYIDRPETFEAFMPVPAGTPPQSFTLSPWTAPVSNIPAGDVIWAHVDESSEGGWEIPQSEIDRIVDHVHGWTGMLHDGRPAECTRARVTLLLRQCPHYRRAFVKAIDDVTDRGYDALHEVGGE